MKIRMGFLTFMTKQKITLSVIALLSSVVSVWAQCPTVDNATPSFCDSANSTVADLNNSVTDGGNGIAWYEAANGGEALVTTTVLENGKTYFVDDAAGTCGVRSAVTISITNVNKPVSTNVAWGLCRESVTVQKTLQDGIDLNTFVGDDSALRYYADEFTTTQMELTDELAAGSFVWAAAFDQASGCESERQAVIVVYVDAIKPVGASPQPFCKQEGVVHTIADIVTDTGNTFYLNNDISDENNVPGTTPIQDGVSYFISNKKPGCESERLEVVVKLVDQEDAGEPGTMDVCIIDIGNQQPLDLFAELSGTPLTTGSWTDPQGVDIAGGHNPVVDITGLGEGANTYTYSLPAAADPATDPCPPPTATVTVNVMPEVDAGEDNNNVPPVCSTDPAFDIYALLGGTPDQGGTWLPALDSGTNEFNPAIDVSGVYTYTVDNGVCPPASKQVTIAVQLAPDPGVSVTLPFCESDVPNEAPFNLRAQLDGTPATGGVWTTDSGLEITQGFKGRVDISTLTADGSPYLFTYTLLGTPVCPAPEPSTVTIEIEPTKEAGQDGSTIICSNEGVVDLLTRLSGTPDAGGQWTFNGNPVSGQFDQTVDLPGVYTYTVENTTCVDDVSNLTVTLGNFVDPGTGTTLNFCVQDDITTQPPLDLFAQLTGNPDLGGSWTDPQGVDIVGGHNPAPVVIADYEVGTYNYTYTTSGDCNNMSVVSVVVDPLPDAGATKTDDVVRCSTDGTLNLIDHLGGTPIDGGQWTFNGQNVDGVVDLATAQSGTYTYTVTSIGCAGLQDIESVTLDIKQALSTGDSVTKNYCFEELAQAADVVLFDELGGTPDIGGTWTIPPGSGVTISDAHVGTIDIKGLEAGDYNFVYSIPGDCSSQPSSVLISVAKQLSSGTKDNPVTICTGEGPLNLITKISGEPDAGGQWSYNGNPVSGDFDPESSLEGVYTYTQSAGACTVADVSTVTVTIADSPDPGENGARNFCITDAGNFPIFNLFDELSGTPQTDGVWTAPAGSGIATSNGHTGTVDINSLVNAGTYTFEYTVPATAECPEETSEVNVIIDPIPNAGELVNVGPHTVCATAESFSLSSLLTNSQPNGVWTDTDNNDAEVAGVLDPTSVGVGTFNYKYTVTSVGCVTLPPDSIDVQVVVEESSYAGEGVTVNYCIADLANQTDLILFNELGGVPETGGVWTDEQDQELVGGHLASVSIANLTGTENKYTYTVASKNNSCPTSTAEITISIDPIPDAGDPLDPSGTTTKCSSDPDFDLFTILNSDAQAGGTWTDLSGNPVDAIFSPSNAVLGLHKFNYTVVSEGCQLQDTRQVQVDVTQGPDAGVDGTFDICIANITGNNTNVNLFDQLGGFTKSTNGTWDDASLGNGHLGTLDLSNLAAGTYTYKYTVAQLLTCPADESEVVVTIEAIPEAGVSILPTVFVCDNEPAFNLFDLLVADSSGNAPQTGGVWTNKTTGAVITNGMYDPAVDSSDTFVYTIASNSCASGAATSEVVISEKALPTVSSFAAAGSGSICENSPASVTITGDADAEVTFDYTGNTQGAQTVVIGTGGSVTYTTTENISSDVTFTLQNISYPGPKGCSQAIANPVANATVTVEQLPTATIEGTADICENTSPVITFKSSDTPNGVVTYSIGAGDLQATLVNGELVLPSQNLSVDTTYELKSITSPNGCTQNINNQSAVITVIATPTAVFDPGNGLTACQGDSRTLKITSSSIGAVVTYTVTGVAAPSTVTIDANGEAGILVDNIQSNTTVSLTSIVTSGATPCSASFTNVDQTIVVSAPLSITNFDVSSNSGVCAGSTIGLAITGTPNAKVNYEVKSLNTGSVLSSGSVDIPQSGVYSNPNLDDITITENSTLEITSIVLGCTKDTNLPAAITVNTVQAPNLSTAEVQATSPEICFGLDYTVNVTGATGLSVGNHTINYTIGANASPASLTITDVNGNGSFTVPASELTNEGSNTIQVADIVSNNGCTVSGTTFSVDQISFVVQPQIGVFNVDSNTKYLCVKDDATFTFSDLSSEYSGLAPNQTIKWYSVDKLTNPSAQANPDTAKVINGTYYAYLFDNSTLCESMQSVVITIELDKCHTVTDVVTPTSPNPGGNNPGSNVFQIYDIKFLYPNYTFDIYNRYGVKLFEGNAANPTWDGKSSQGNLGGDDVVPTGVYFYIINFNEGDTKPEQGYFYLSR